MTTVLYADVLFVINFSMDFISLWITAKLLSIRQKTWRYALSAALGAAGATAMTALVIEGIAGALLALALPVAMALVAYGFGTARRLAARSLALWGTGALIGGAVTALCSLGERTFVADAVGGASRSWGLASLGVLLVWAFVRFLRPRLGKTSAAVRISVGGVSAEAEALVDTGNIAVDPVTGDAVIFVSLPFAARLIGEANARLVCALKPDELPPEYRLRVRIVPTSGVGETGVCGAIVPDAVFLPPDRTPRRAVVCVADVAKDHFGGYEALLPTSIL